MFTIHLNYGAAIAMSISTLAGAALADDSNYPDHPFYDASGRYAGVYLCIPEVSGGLKFDDSSRRWNSSGFDVQPNATFLFKVDLNDMTWVGLAGVKYKAAAYKVTIKSLGSQDIEYCTPKTAVNGDTLPTYGRLTYVSDDDQILCSSTKRDYTLNLKTLRYMSVDPRGYVDGYDEDNYSASIWKRPARQSG